MVAGGSSWRAHTAATSLDKAALPVEAGSAPAFATAAFAPAAAFAAASALSFASAFAFAFASLLALFFAFFSVFRLDFASAGGVCHFVTLPCLPTILSHAQY